MRSISCFSSAAVIAGVMAFGVQPMTAEISTKLTGCLVRGDGDGAGYLLVNVAAEPTVASSSQVLPTAIGTSGTYANVFYWLDNDGDLRAHVGHQVEIEGETEGDVKDGEMKIDRKDQWTEIEIHSDGRTMKAQVPNASIVASPNPDRKMEVLVRRVDVDKVRMLSATCR